MIIWSSNEVSSDGGYSAAAFQVQNIQHKVTAMDLLYEHLHIPHSFIRPTLHKDLYVAAVSRQWCT